MGLTKEEAPFTRPYALAGNPKGFKSKGNTALAVKRALAHLGFLDWTPETWDYHWNQKLNDACASWKRKRGIIASTSNDGSWGEKSHDVMRSAWFEKSGDRLPAFDGGSQQLLREEFRGAQPPPDPLPDLGPMWKGGVCVLDQDLTHATSGIDLYPAFDDAFVAGREIIAPEKITVTQASSSNPGDAFYAEGVSGLAYWVGHLVVAPGVGRSFSKGAVLGSVLETDIGGGSHCHVGVNIERLRGDGEELIHHTDYTHGAPTIGEQLAA
jgi:hypothetical protein